ncbi:SUKH-3 domain-containing protein [Stackebrandtia soli]|uniref:SUKH-3 domain-containing protein n=1 Tax=Stackebrandtia soli TaxID=1892856 RepID=UPI0039EABCBB
MSGLSAESVRTLESAGWFPGRRVDVTGLCAKLEGEGFVVHGVARRFLAEFSGLRIPAYEGGNTRAREAIDFNPIRMVGEDDRFIEWGQDVGEAITPIGELDQGQFLLGIGESSTIYSVINWLGSFGSGIEGLENLILGVMPETIG